MSNLMFDVFLLDHNLAAVGNWVAVLAEVYAHFFESILSVRAWACGNLNPQHQGFAANRFFTDVIILKIV